MIENQKKVWITGASSGIGKAVAEKFANEGWKVAISARRKEILDDMAKNKNLFSYPLDVTNQEQVNNVFKKIIDDFGEINLCIFSSGTYDPKNEQSINVEKIKNVINVNFIGVVNCVKSVESYFKKKRSGQISIVSSVAGYRGLPAAGAYCASKAALTSFSESLFFDLKRYNVRVTVVSPGFIKTPMTDKNSFKMPMIKTPEFAAEEMYEGMVNKNNFEIHFPKSFTRLMKILKFIPNKLYFKLLEKGMNRKIKS